MILRRKVWSGLSGHRVRCFGILHWTDQPTSHGGLGILSGTRVRMALWLESTQAEQGYSEFMLAGAWTPQHYHPSRECRSQKLIWSVCIWSISKQNTADRTDPSLHQKISKELPSKLCRRQVEVNGFPARVCQVVLSGPEHGALEARFEVLIFRRRTVVRVRGGSLDTHLFLVDSNLSLTGFELRWSVLRFSSGCLVGHHQSSAVMRVAEIIAKDVHLSLPRSHTSRRKREKHRKVAPRKSVDPGLGCFRRGCHRSPNRPRSEGLLQDEHRRNQVLLLGMLLGYAFMRERSGLQQGHVVYAIHFNASGIQMKRTVAFAVLNILFGAAAFTLATPSKASALDDKGHCCVESTSHEKYCCANCCSGQNTCSKSEDCRREV